MRVRVVATGVGAITPLGNSAPAMWEAITEGRSGIGPITVFDATDYDTRIAGEIKGLESVQVMDPKAMRRAPRFVVCAVAAACEAVSHARFNVAEYDGERVGVVIGSCGGGWSTLLENYDTLKTRGPRRVSPFLATSVLPDLAAAQVAIELGARGPNMTIGSACATGTDAIGQAAEMLRSGAADVVIAGGVDTVLHPIMFAGFNVIRALSTANDSPAEASRPFDAARDGFVLGEGAGVMVLERLEDAQRRGAPILGEVAGYASAADAFHLVAPAEDGDGIFRAMRQALRDAGLAPSDVDYINAHGTGTPLNDKIETQAVKRLFGEHAYRLAISSTKSMMGHLMGAAGAVEAVICLKAMEAGRLPPTINYRTPDPDCDLDYVPNVSRPANIRVAMSNSIGLGGRNASLVLRRV